MEMGLAVVVVVGLFLQFELFPSYDMTFAAVLICDALRALCARSRDAYVMLLCCSRTHAHASSGGIE